MVFAQTWWARYAIWNCSITYRTKHTMDRWTVLMRLSPEKKIFSSKLEPLFGDCECVIVDVGYSGTKCILHKRILGRQWRVNIPKVSRAWEETVNERLKKFYILKNVYRNHIDTHRNVFFAVLNITVLLFWSGEYELFNIDSIIWRLLEKQYVAEYVSQWMSINEYFIFFINFWWQSIHNVKTFCVRGPQIESGSK